MAAAPSPADLGLTKCEADLVQTWHAEEVARLEKVTLWQPPGYDWHTLYQERLDQRRQGGWRWSLQMCPVVRARLFAHRDAQRWARLTSEQQAEEKARQWASFVEAGYAAKGAS